MPKRNKRKSAFPGLNSRRKRLADGTWRTYYYAFKGGPALPGEYGSPDFIAAYLEATKTRKAPPAGVLFSLLSGYQDSSEFRRLAARTRADYVKQIKKIEGEFGDMPLAALADRRTRGEFKAWRDKLAISSVRQADYAFTVLARVLSWSLDRGLIRTNPCEKAGRLYSGSRVESVWSDDDESAFLKLAPQQFHLPLLIALWTGQRQGDILALTWRQYDGESIRLQQGKTGARVTVPLGKPLRDRLDALKVQRNPGPFDRLVLTTRGVPWSSGESFSSAFKKATRAAGIDGLTFHDTRGTAVTRLAQAGCGVPQIATFTGHSLRDAQQILDAHYLNRDESMARNARDKLEKRTAIPD